MTAASIVDSKAAVNISDSTPLKRSLEDCMQNWIDKDRGDLTEEETDEFLAAWYHPGIELAKIDFKALPKEFFRPSRKYSTLR